MKLLGSSFTSTSVKPWLKNSLLNNSKLPENEVPLRVKYYTPKGIIMESKLNSQTTFGDILKNFESKNKDKTKKLKNEYYLDGRKVEKKELAKTLIQNQEGYNLNEEELWVEVENVEQLDDEKVKPMTKILKPKKDPFGLFIFTPHKGSVTLEEYPEEICKKFFMNKINNSSAYCDSPKKLFLSGGNYFGVSSKDFWIIDHDSFEIEHMHMPESNANHSMVYIPDPKDQFNGKVLIAGGDNPRTYMYDTKEDKFFRCGNLNENHESPALVTVGEYVYCLNAFVNDQEFFEKMKIDGPYKWDKIYPRFKNDVVTTFDNKLFGASPSMGGKILIAGGVDNKNNTFIYDPETNILDLTNGDDLPLKLSDKTFYKVNKDHSIAIPQNFENDHQIAVLNKTKNTLRMINLNEGGNLDISYDLGNNQKKNNLKKSRKEREKELQKKKQIITKGTISVKGKFSRILDGDKVVKSEEYVKPEKKEFDIAPQSNEDGTFELANNKSLGTRTTLRNPKPKGVVEKKDIPKYLRTVDNCPFSIQKEEDQGEKPYYNGCTDVLPIKRKNIIENNRSCPLRLVKYSNMGGENYNDEDLNYYENYDFKTLTEIFREKYKDPIPVEKPRFPDGMKKVEIFPRSFDNENIVKVPQEGEGEKTQQFSRSYNQNYEFNAPFEDQRRGVSDYGYEPRDNTSYTKRSTTRSVNFGAPNVQEERDSDKKLRVAPKKLKITPFPPVEEYPREEELFPKDNVKENLSGSRYVSRVGGRKTGYSQNQFDNNGRFGYFDDNDNDNEYDEESYHEEKHGPYREIKKTVQEEEKVPLYDSYKIKKQPKKVFKELISESIEKPMPKINKHKNIEYNADIFGDYKE